MGVWPEVMQLVDGRLFDEESYERTGLLAGSHPTASGYYVVVWASDRAPTQGARPCFVGPFPSSDLAFTAASKLKEGSVSNLPP